jgi:hypothetical protein
MKSYRDEKCEIFSKRELFFKIFRKYEHLEEIKIQQVTISRHYSNIWLVMQHL